MGSHRLLGRATERGGRRKAVLAARLKNPAMTARNLLIRAMTAVSVVIAAVVAVAGLAGVMWALHALL